MTIRWAKGIRASMDLMEKIKDSGMQLANKTGQKFKDTKAKFELKEFFEDVNYELKEKRFKINVQQVIGDKSDEAIKMFSDLGTTFKTQFDKSNALIEKGQKILPMIKQNEDLIRDYNQMLQELATMNEDAYNGFNQMKKLINVIRETQSERNN